jgi:glycosyltransferase involved in cell wall biosynthesis
MVSAIIPSFNKAPFITSTVKSVLAQSQSELEVIIVDDCSDDGSQEIIETLAESDPRIRSVLNNRNKGANFCRNQGIAMARGEFLLFIDADDLLDHNCFASRTKLLIEKSSLDFAVFPMQVFKEVPGDHKDIWRPSEKHALKNFLSHQLPWQTMQPLWRKRYIQKIGGFDENFKRLQDVELHTRALMQNPEFVCVHSKPDCFFRMGEERMNFARALFLDRWISSAIQYCHKFAPLLSKTRRRFLRGTVFHAYLQLLLNLRSGRISAAEFHAMEDRVLSALPLGIYSRFTLWSASVYNRLFPRIPGVNRFFHLLLVW